MLSVTDRRVRSELWAIDAKSKPHILHMIREQDIRHRRAKQEMQSQSIIDSLYRKRKENQRLRHAYDYTPLLVSAVTNLLCLCMDR